jgi:hypothetical protein
MKNETALPSVPVFASLDELLAACVPAAPQAEEPEEEDTCWGVHLSEDQLKELDAYLDALGED